MSVATTIYDALVTLATSNLTGYTEMPDRIEIEENPSLMMKSGFIVAFGDEINSPEYVSDILMFDRSFTIILTRGMDSTESNTELRKSIEKDIVEDAYVFVKALLNDPTLGGIAVDASYLGQTAIEYLIDNEGTEKFMVISLDISVKYREQY